ncbi:hypothetical protein [Synechococcus sp. PCC 7336]|uniref:hypothetical protein n=1 Tax=Synechococcus sp. PCC 7336 TaxID=195250 RepID=UPI0012EA0473|nr:hypothetical protein [Synechococcus sp. PCC 7336]
MGKLLSQLRDLCDHPLWQNRTRRMAGLGEEKTVNRQLLRAILPVAFLLLMLWNWRLASALLAGSFTMNAVYLLQASQWQQQWQQWSRSLSDSPNLGATLAVAGGLAATLGTYVALSVWSQAGDRWLAIAILMQGIISCGILVAVLGQARQQRRLWGDRQFEALLREIASPESLQRLLATRQLQGHLQGLSVTPEQRQLATDYVQLALERESVPQVREALLDLLQVGRSAEAS